MGAGRVIVCHCKRVPGSVIEGAVAAGATTLGDVAAHCQAGTRCGSCLSTIEALLAVTDGFPAEAAAA